MDSTSMHASIHSDYPPRDCTDTLKRPLSRGDSLETYCQQCRCTLPYYSRPHFLHHHRPQHHNPQHHHLQRPASTAPSSVMPIIRCPIIGKVSRDRFPSRSLSRDSTLTVGSIHDRRYFDPSKPQLVIVPMRNLIAVSWLVVL